jgi:hypothetical protein
MSAPLAAMEVDQRLRRDEPRRKTHLDRNEIALGGDQIAERAERMTIAARRASDIFCNTS